jgi:hypothetical protein
LCLSASGPGFSLALEILSVSCVLLFPSELILFQAVKTHAC